MKYQILKVIKPDALFKLGRRSRLAMLLVFLIFEFSACDEATELKSMRVTAIPNLRMREEPSITSKSIAFPKYGELVDSQGEVGEEEIHDRVRGRWSRIIYKGQEGYVFGGFLKEIPVVKKTPVKPAADKKFKGVKITSILIWSGVGIAVLVGLIMLMRKRRAIISKFKTRQKFAKKAKKKSETKQGIIEIKKTNPIEEIVQVWYRTGDVVGSGKRSDTYVSGGGSVREGTGSVSISSTVVVQQEFFLREDNGEETPVQISGFDIPIRDGQRVTMIYVARKNVDSGWGGRLVNLNANKFFKTNRPRRLLKLLGLRGETSTGTGITWLILSLFFTLIALAGGSFFRFVAGLGGLGIIASLIYLIYHSSADSLGYQLDNYLDAKAREQLANRKG